MNLAVGNELPNFLFFLPDNELPGLLFLLRACSVGGGGKNGECLLSCVFLL